MAEPVLPHGDLRNRREPVPAPVQGGPDGRAERLHPQAGGDVGSEGGLRLLGRGADGEVRLRPFDAQGARPAQDGGRLPLP